MRSREDSEEISLKHSGYAYVYTREGSLVAGGKWVRVAADLENLTLRLDNTHMTETNRDKYCKEMTITAGTTVLRAPQPGRPHCLALSDFNAASGKRRVLDCLTQEGVTAWFDLLTRRDGRDAGARGGEADARARQLVAATRDLRASLGSAAFDASSAADVARSVRSVIRDGELPRNAGTALANFPADVCAAAPDDRFTALLRCCANGDGQGAELWLTLGADANHADHGPEKRTLMACAAGDTHLAKMLLATGRCAVDARDALGAPRSAARPRPRR
ncbi:hypothetical protein JL722_4726 [Aureococcus anophagefferens]|nr:hypothetical protein JL722_4726 [Aureococcus anophagefferens]